MFVYSIVTITRLYDYQTWQTRFWRNSRGAQRLMGFFLDCFSDADWLRRQTRETPANKEQVCITPLISSSGIDGYQRQKCHR